MITTRYSHDGWAVESWTVAAVFIFYLRLLEHLGTREPHGVLPVHVCFVCFNVRGGILCLKSTVEKFS